MRPSINDLTEDAQALAAYLNVAKQSSFFLKDEDVRPLLTQGQQAVQRGLKEAFLIDGAGKVARVWNKVSVKGHADEVLAAAKAL